MRQGHCMAGAHSGAMVRHSRGTAKGPSGGCIRGSVRRIRRTQHHLLILCCIACLLLPHLPVLPSFVIKTADTVDGTKIFINVCASDKVPAPGNWSTGQVPEEVSCSNSLPSRLFGGFNSFSKPDSPFRSLPQVQKALENRDNGADAESLRFPLSCGQPKMDMDRKGQRCLTCDCIINADVLKQVGS